MRPITTRSTAVAGILLAGLAILCAGCTDDNAPTPSPSATATERAPQLPGQPEGVVGATALPTDVPNDPAVRDRVTIDDCAAVDGGWSAGGTVTAGPDEDTSIDITVFFVVPSGTVVGSGRTDVDVAAGGTASWSVEGVFTASESTTCVLRGAA